MEGLVSILGREPYELDLEPVFKELAGKKVLVTGAEGSIGSELVKVLTARGIHVYETDLYTMDVRDRLTVAAIFSSYKPDVVFHLAGAKHAPEGEEDPYETSRTNVEGTHNVLVAASYAKAKVVTASTCKAGDPETAYGASKLIAERETLNAGGTVIRFYNVVETQGNVFELWANTDGPIKVTYSFRRFISLSEAVGLALWGAVLPSGRYVLDVAQWRSMDAVADDLYPDREKSRIPLRRGDRMAEPKMARSERLSPVFFPDGSGLHFTLQTHIARVVSPHDPKEPS